MGFLVEYLREVKGDGVNLLFLLGPLARSSTLCVTAVTLLCYNYGFISSYLLQILISSIE